MSTVQWHYGTKVVLPRRVKADLATIVAVPAAILYTVFRDAAGGGVSLGKRALGLTIIRLVDGRRCTARHVWARNLLDVVPIINVIDFIMMCVDRRGQKIMDRWLQLQVVEVCS